MTEFNILGRIDGYYDSHRAALKAALDNSVGQEVVFNIASEGGDVLEGLALAAMIADYKGKTVAKGFGIVASIATIIMLAADKKYMSKSGFFMIHNSWTYTAGSAKEMTKDIELLEKIDAQLLNVYVSQIEAAGKLIDGDRDKTEKKVKKMMDAETWLTADEAMDLGLIDGIIEKEEETNYGNAAFARLRAQVTNYKNLPTNIKNDMQKEEKKGMLSALAAFFGFKAEIKEIEAPEAVAVEETPEAVTETPESVETETATEDPQAAKLAEMEAKLKAMEEAIAAKTKEVEGLEIKAQALKADYKEEPKAGDKNEMGLPQNVISQLGAFAQSMFK